MAFAPYAACLKKLVKGCFKSASGAFFEYAALEEGEFVPFPGYEMKVYCGPFEEWRYANFVASRAYVVVEEEWVEGVSLPVVEKWVIKSHKKYELAS
jgi:hypothetical protein